MQKYIIALFLGVLLIHCAVARESDTISEDEQDKSATFTLSSSGIGGGFNPDYSSPVDGNFGGAGTCYSDEVKQETQAVNMVILLDRSGSMSGFRWDTSVIELEKFIVDPKSFGINIALSYFPALPYDAHCDEKLYEKPYIPFGLLPINSSTLTTSLNNVIPDGGGTPLYGAMLGTYNWLIPYATHASGEQTMLLIVSDGSPNTCGYVLDAKEELAKIAGDALKTGVKTATIGLSGANLAVLNHIAKAGGTDVAVDITYDTSALYKTLNVIRNSFQCEYIFDKTQTFDPGQWFVQYLSSNGFPDWIIPRVANKTECSKKHGWYYDDNTDPSKLILCAKACDILTFDDDFTLQLAFGCPGDHGIVK